MNTHAELSSLQGIWPAEHLPLLAPRACLLCEGTAFSKVVRLDPTKLKTSNTDGIKLVVSTLGGVWGQSKLEKKYERFERAIFGTVQKTDETNMSYIARHEVQYEDMISLGATLEEMRAYILLRNSGLPAEDKKRVIIDAKGNLEYKQVIETLQLLGSRFFGEVQTGSSKIGGRTKTYDVNYVDEGEGDHDEDEQVFMAHEMSEDAIMESFLAEGDEDALVIQQFEDAVIESLQNDPEVAVCLNSYADARRRLQDKSKGRGFWAPRPGKSKGKGKFKGSFKNKFRKPLAQRILESSCRACGQVGHWKAECPNKAKSAPPNASGASAFAGVSMLQESTTEDAVVADVVDELPENAVAFMMEAIAQRPKGVFQPENKVRGNGLIRNFNGVRVDEGELRQKMQQSCQSLKARLQSICRNSRNDGQNSRRDQMPQPAPRHDPLRAKVDFIGNHDTEWIHFVSQGTSGIVDLGASMSVIGIKQFEELCNALPATVKCRMREAPCAVSFRFGNNSTVTGKRAVFFPIGQQWMKVIVVPSHTPFLIANSVFRALGAVIDTGSEQIFFQKLGRSIPISLSERNLFCLDLLDLLVDPEPKASAASALTVQSDESDQQKCPRPEVCQVPRVDQKDQVSESKVGGTNHQTDQSLQSPVTHDHGQVSSNMPHEHADSQLTAKQDCRFETAQRETVTLFADHGVQHESPVRSAGRKVAPSVTGLRDRRGGATEPNHGDVVRRTQQQMHGLWKGSSWQELPRYDQGDPLHDLVCRSVPWQSKTTTCALPALHPAPCGETRGREEHLFQTCDGHSEQSQGESQAVASSPSRGSLGKLRRGDGSTHRSLMGHSSEPDRDERDAAPHGGSRECASTSSELAEQQSAQPAIRSVEMPGHPEVESHVIADIYTILQGDDTHKIWDPMGDSEIGYDVGENIFLSRSQNWVAKEMWNHLGKRGALHHPDKLAQNATDLLEVYCSQESSLTNTAQQLGMSANRHGLSDGDLATCEGRCKLYDRMLELRPRNIWLSLKRRAWCRWNTYNMSKSPELAQRILQARENDVVHLLLCDALFQFQTWRSNNSHAHLEQPVGSHMMFQEELAAIRQQTWRARCDMCTAGRLRHPISHEFLQKGTQVLTTSYIMKEQLDRLRCQHDHVHVPVAGQVVLPEVGRVNLSQFTELYTRTFAQKVLRCMQCSERLDEPAPAGESALTSSSNDPEPKGQKISEKRPPTEADLRVQKEQQVQKIIQEVMPHAPHVGKRLFRSGPVFDLIAMKFPDKQIHVIEACKGADRFRAPPPDVQKSQAPLRMTMGINRTNASVFWEEQWEDWTHLTRKQLIRKSPPARLIITVFAAQRSTDPNVAPRETDQQFSEEPHATKRPRINPCDDKKIADAEPSSSQSSQSLEPSVEKQSLVSKTQHGPKFMRLSSEQRQQLIRMHSNLGHPNVTLLGNVLRDQGWPM